jgi:hypothetical protein
MEAWTAASMAAASEAAKTARGMVVAGSGVANLAVEMAVETEEVVLEGAERVDWDLVEVCQGVEMQEACLEAADKEAVGLEASPAAS